jgi:hypothetical protein
MHPIMHQQLADARVADLRRQAERDRMARLARKGPSRLPASAHRVMALARGVLAVLGGRRPRRARATPTETLPPPASCGAGCDMLVMDSASGPERRSSYP